MARISTFGTSFRTLAGAFIALPLVAATPAAAENSTAYPQAPTNAPAASDKGKPVEPKSDAGADPGTPGKASTEKAPTKAGTPSSAYPDAPGAAPSSDNSSGKAPKP